MNTPPPTNVLVTKSDLVHQTSRGPSLHEVASELLTEALKTFEPALTLDPDHAAIATPASNGVPPTDTAMVFETLTHAVIRQGLEGTHADYFNDRHFLTATPQARPAVQLPVDMPQLSGLLNGCTQLLFVTYQERQLAFWNATGASLPRWQELSDTFKEALNGASPPGWNADQCALANLIARNPIKAERMSHTALAQIKVGLPDIDQLGGTQNQHLILGGAIILTGTYLKQPLHLMYSISQGYETFSSMASLGESLPRHMGLNGTAEQLTWRLYEPDGSLFDWVAWALISTQLEAIEALAGSGSTLIESGPLPAASAEETARLARLQSALPEWLKNATVDDQQAYSNGLSALGKLHAQYDIAAANGNIASIDVFAQTKMREAIVGDKKPGGESLALDKLSITTTDSMEVGGLLLPDPSSQRSETLGEFALQNTPAYMTSLAFTDQTTVPDWLTPDYLSEKSEQVDIGEAYPALIKRTLLDDTPQAALHKAHYIRLLRILLPMQALECKLAQREGFDEQGYNQVLQSLTPNTAAASAAVICPFAFVPQRRLSGASDRVSNMFIITSQADPEGVCVLYRPLFNPPLMQFPSTQNLLFALRQNGELRENVLAWLPTPAVSFEYANYVFGQQLPSLLTLAQLAFEPLIHLDMIGPVSLLKTPISGDIFEHLYSENASTLQTLAERQSVSNRERRWVLLVESGWAIFSVASNFLTGAAGTAVWVWQSIQQIQRALGDYEQGEVNWKSMAEVLLTLGILLMQHVALRRMSGKKTEPIDEYGVHAPQVIKPHVSVSHQPLSLTGPLPASHLAVLAQEAIAAPRSGTGFIQHLKTFAVAKPEGIGPSLDPRSHLYQLEGKHYAPVGSYWFQIRVVGDDPLVIQDPTSPGRTGLAIQYDAALERWHWDLKLRLRGGGKTGAEQSQKARLAELDKQLSEFTAISNIEERKRRIEMGRHAHDLIPQDESLDIYLRQLKIAIDQCASTLSLFNEWLRLGGRSPVGHTRRLRATSEHMYYVTLWLADVHQSYNAHARKVLDEIDFNALVVDTDHLDRIREVIALGREMITNIEAFEASQPALNTMSHHPGLHKDQIDKLKAVSTDRTITLQSYHVEYLKANEIGLTGELCIRPPWSEANAQARAAIGQFIEATCGAAHELARRNRGSENPDSLDENILSLDRLIDRFTDSQQRLLHLPDQFPDQLEPAPLERLRSLISDLLASATAQRVALRREQRKQQKSTQPRAGTSRAAQKISKSYPQSSATARPGTDTAQALSPLVIVEPKVSTPQPRTRADETVISQALELNLDATVDSIILQLTHSAERRYHIAEDVDHLFEQQIKKYQQAAVDVEQILAKPTLAGASQMPVEHLPAELRSAAERIRTAGIGVHARMLKLKKPRQTYFQWLLANEQLTLRRDTRGRIRTQKGQDYFQEYQIQDRSRDDADLWVAHFHYISLDSPADQFTAAHLKVAEKYLASLAPTLKEQLSTLERVDYEQRKITDPHTLQAFLTLEPIKR